MFHWIREFFQHLYAHLGLEGQFLYLISALTVAVLLFSAGVMLYYIIRIILQNVVRVFNRKIPSKLRTALLEERFFIRLSFLIPVFILKHLIPEFFVAGTRSELFLSAVISILIITNITLILNAFIKALGDILMNLEATKDKPIKSYVQIISTCFWAIAIILFISILIHKSPMAFLAGLGAFSAVLMLVFQDTIVGFVNSIQLSTNNLLRNGDWITVDKHNVDGTVEEISLLSVKVRNFDGTVSTVPARQLITDSFQNWRGMEEQGVRRIKRSFSIDSTSIKNATPEMLAISNSKQETNLGCFCEYLSDYLHKRKDICKDNTLIVRILQPNEYGVPLEIYCFAKTTVWVDYEKIQTEITEHILVALPKFDLVYYQRK